MRKWIIYFALVLFCASCSTHSTPQKKKILKLNFSKNPPTLDPRKGGDPISSTFQFMLFDGLTGMTKDSTSSLMIAKSCEISEDFKTYKFQLKETKWSNGDWITAQDFEKSWKDMLRPDFPCPNSHLLFPIKNAQKVKNGLLPIDELKVYAKDDHTLIVELEHPTPYFLELTSFCALFPVCSSKNTASDYSYDAPNPNFPVSGAFRIKEWKPGYEMILEKNPYYHSADLIEIDEIKISFVTDDMTAFNLFENKEIDILGGFFSDIPMEEAQALKEQNRLETVSIGSTTFCSFNLDKYPFHNRNIRKAFSYAINRDEIVQNILQYGEIKAFGCIPPFMKKGMIKEYLEIGSQKTAEDFFSKGLKELGIAKEEFPEIILTVGISNLHKRIAVAIQNQIETTLGIKVRLETLDLKVYLDKINSKKHTFALCMSVIQYNDIMNILERFRLKSNSKNFSAFENAVFIKNLDESSKSNRFDSRLHHFLQAEKILLEEAAIAPLFHSNFVYIKQDHIHGFYVSPIGSMHVNFISIEDTDY
jgi:oligopeptide transport system substrate-binding protein